MNLYLTTNCVDYKVECSQVKAALVITEKLNFANLATGKIQTGFFFHHTLSSLSYTRYYGTTGTSIAF